MSKDEIRRWSRKGRSQLKEDDVARSPWFKIEIERESHGEGRINEVLDDDVEMLLALGRSGERGFRY